MNNINNLFEIKCNKYKVHVLNMNIKVFIIIENRK